MRNSRWVLTDVAKDIYLDNFAVGAGDVPTDGRQPWPWRIAKRTLRGGPREGVDLVELDNGRLSVSILPTRGMSLWRGRLRPSQPHGRELAVGWRSPIVGPVHPSLVDLNGRGGIGWLDGFDEWIVRCGLTSNGAPGPDMVPDNNGNPRPITLPLHGRIANTPASSVQVRVGLSEPYELSVSGTVSESALFCGHLELRSEIVTTPGASGLTIRDEVVNRGATPTEVQLLYHCNFGDPWLEEGARVVAPVNQLAPRDARAAEGIDTWAVYPAPTAGFVEQCYFAELAGRSPPPSAGETGGVAHLGAPSPGLAGPTGVMLRSAQGQWGAMLRFDRRQLPCFTLWKNPAALADGYVTGLEPGTNFPNTRAYERSAGRVVTLAPGASYQVNLTVDLLDTAEGVRQAEAEITALQGGGAGVIHRRPVARFSPVG